MNLHRATIPAPGAELAALVYTPDRAPRALPVVLAHGFTACKASMDLLAAYLAGRGYPCLTFDFRGHLLGGSTGRLDHMAEAVDDLRAATAFARQRFAQREVALVGHSMGALVSFAAAADDPDVRAIAAIATGPRPSASFDSPVGQAMLAQRAPYVVGAPPMALLREMDGLAASVERLEGRPALFVAARGDVLVKPDVLEAMSRRAGTRAEFAEVEGAHLDAPDRARGVVAAWLDRLRVEG